MKSDERLIEIWDKKCGDDANGKITQATLTFEQLTLAEKSRLFDLIKSEKYK